MERPAARTTIFQELEDNSMDILNDYYEPKVAATTILDSKIDSLQYELDQIKNSRRYKFIDKLANIKNKLTLK